MMVADKYRFRHALRPFSFSVALVVCLTGILAAYAETTPSTVHAVLILLGGLLLQAGVNLINDYSDLPHLGEGQQLQQRQILFNFNAGLSCFLSAAAIGVYLIWHTGLELLLLALLGLIGALGYTLEPINYKRRGLAVFMVFWLMGVLMVAGSYYILSQQLNLRILLVAVPVSLYTALLLLSNEIRDFEADRRLGVATLTVRIGFARAVLLYKLMLVAIVVSTLLCGLIWSYWLWLALLALPVMLQPIRWINLPAETRWPLTPGTGRAFLCFGLLYALALLF